MTTAAAAGIQRQISLPMSKAFEISMRSIRNRFWRTLITAIGILLGIAFLVSVISASYFTRAAAYSYGIHSPQWIAYQKMLDLGQIQTRQAWLVALALLVSTIGILNSMLMSVAERYREIGTMKCLGAMDAFIIRVFIIEAVLTGTIASALGAVLGFILIFLSYLGQQGTNWLSHGNCDFLDLFKWILLSIVGGSLLALFASAWPAALAAKMPPAAAFRVEV